MAEALQVLPVAVDESSFAALGFIGLAVRG
jgi:hypothetical protein